MSSYNKNKMPKLNTAVRLIKIAFKIFPKLSLLTFLLVIFSIILELPLPLLTVYFIDKVLPSKDINLLNLIGVVLIFFLTFRISSDFWSRYLNTLLLEKITMKFGIQAFESVLNAYFISYITKPSGYWTNRIQNEPRSIAQIFAAVVEVLTQSLTLFVGIFFTVYFSLKLGLLIFLTLPFYIWTLFLLGPKIKKQSLLAKEESARIAGFIEESLSGLEVLKVLSIENFRLNELKSKWENFLGINLKFSMLVALSNLIATGIASIAPIGLLWYGGYLVMTGDLTLGALIGINRFISYIFRPVASLLNLNARIQDALAALERMDEIMNLPKERQDGNDFKIKAEAGIEIKSLTFSYTETDHRRNIFDKLNLEIKGRKITAIVGESGCGKSTLLKLIIGLLKPQGGKILIDGIDLEKINVSSLRKQVCLIPQNASLFCGSVGYNITLGCDRKQIDRWILEVTGVDKFLNSLEFSFDYDIGSKGLKLSGGQRQRVAFARALIREPKILLLDEVTSEIDVETESEIIDRIIELRKEKTTVIVAHSISAIRRADEIIVMSSGHIVERGSHEDLMKLKGPYYKLYSTQRSH